MAVGEDGVAMRSPPHGDVATQVNPENPKAALIGDQAAGSTHDGEGHADGPMIYSIKHSAWQDILKNLIVIASVPGRTDGHGGDTSRKEKASQFGPFIRPPQRTSVVPVDSVTRQ